MKNLVVSVWLAVVLIGRVTSFGAPLPTPQPPLQLQNPWVWSLMQPIDAEVREYLASSGSRSPEALDALARHLKGVQPDR